VTLLVEWARACGLVRVVRGRMVAVGKRAGLLERPFDLVDRLLAALPRLVGELGHSVVAADAAHTVEALFGDLVGRGGTLPLERACEVAWSTAMRRYWFPDATPLQIDMQRRHSDGDVCRILDAVAGLGVLTVDADVIACTASAVMSRRGRTSTGWSRSRVPTANLPAASTHRWSPRGRRGAAARAGAGRLGADRARRTPPRPASQPRRRRQRRRRPSSHCRSAPARDPGRANASNHDGWHAIVEAVRR